MPILPLSYIIRKKKMSPATSTTSTPTKIKIDLDMDLFERAHKEQLESLQIPPVLWGSLAEQLQASFPLQIQATNANANANANANGGLTEEAVVLLDPQGSIDACQNQCKALLTQKKHEEIPQKMGTMLVLPHVSSWDMLDGRGMYEALSNMPENVLTSVYQGLLQATTVTSTSSSSENNKAEIASSAKDKNALVNRICEVPEIWSYVILYRGQQGQVRAALPSPPYLPHVEYAAQTDLDRKEADLVGPFPFQYYHALTKGDQDQPPQMLLIECSLAYLSGDNLTKLLSPSKVLPTMDVVPAPTVPNALTRMVRYAALLGPKHAPEFCISQCKEIHATFVRQMHLVRQQKLEADLPDTSTKTTTNTVPSKEIWKVYTDAPNNKDPLELTHPDCGLTSSKFQVVSDPHVADIFYSYQSVFAPNSPLNSILEKEKTSFTTGIPLINQFPYEGAFVQKDHLGREILKQHGLPKPSWAMETYDLDVQLGEFVGAAILAMENEAQNNHKPPLWIIKPAKGTQSRGHVVTRNLAQIMRLVDAGGYSKVAQRYIVSIECSYSTRFMHGVLCMALFLVQDFFPSHSCSAIHYTLHY